MTIRGLHGVSQLDVTGGVKLAVKLIVRTGLVEQLQPPMDARQAKGRPNQYPTYTVLAVLATWFHLMYRGLPATVANILRCLWVDYTPEQLVMLGLPRDWRDPDRLESMQALPAVHEQEYNRLHKFVVEMTDPIDDTPFPANRNITWAEIRRALAENTERLQPKTDLRMTAMNDIVAASVPVELFGNFQGHLATDEHMVVICPDPRETPTAAHKKKLGPPAASYWPKSLRFDGAAVIGLTLAIAVSEPGQPAIPTGIALGMATGPALAADIPGALISIDAADRHPVMSKASKSIWRFVIGDKAYPYGKGFVAALNDRGRYMLGDFRMGQPHVLPLWASPEDTDCPKLANGCIVCPGIPQATLEAADPRLHEQYDNMSPAQLKAVQDSYDYIEAGRMPTNGRPKRSVKRKPGRPSKTTDKPTETVFKVEVFCPARRGKIRCSRVPESMNSTAKHIAHPDDNTMSYVCTGGATSKTQLSISEADFKTYSPLMAGTLDHHDFYKHARAHNEGFHTFLVSPEGANLRDRTLRWRRTSAISISIAFAVAIVNIRSTDAYLESQRRNGGTAPDGARTTIRKARNQGDDFAA